MNDAAVRLAHAEDLEPLRELLQANGSPFDVDAEFARRYARLLLAGSAQAILGVLLAWEVADEVHLIDLLVAPGARRRGVASTLLRDLVARSSAFRVILLEVRRDNAAARGLYTRFGFEVVGERERYYADGEDALLMQLKLGEATP
ncbi:MAG: GNAT family N-acetyltransferase [Polyangiaceae bacterium]